MKKYLVRMTVDFHQEIEAESEEDALAKAENIGGAIPYGDGWAFSDATYEVEAAS